MDNNAKKQSTVAYGLTAAEAAKRISQYGYNEIIEKRQSRFIKFALYFWGPISWMIEAAAILSAVLQHWDDLAIVLVLLFANGIIGFWQENKADNAVEVLKKRLAVKARVMRDGAWTTIPARELVPGDLVRLKLGDIIPADVKLVSGDYLLVDESALTGESLPVEKHVSDKTFSGAIAKVGEMDAVVTATGKNTYFGKTTELVQKAKSQSHLQKAVMQIGYYLIIVAVILVAIVLTVSLLRGEDFLTVVQFSLILLVASIPVAMPAVLSVSMAVGAMALAKKEAIVTKLETIEEVAGMDVLCVDKTGTITKNEIDVADVKSFGETSKDDVIIFAALASRREDNDPIDLAILKVMDKNTPDALDRYNITKYTPFNPVIKRAEAVCTDKTKKESVVVTKGAPQVIVSLVNKNDTLVKEVNDSVEYFASKGYRTIAVAEGKKSNLKLVGLLALYDPPREDSKETINFAEELGVDVKMITGDHIAIAKEMCREVGIGPNTMSVQALQSPSTKPQDIENADAFAEVFPEHKYNIVKALQKMGHIVGMTGDGVNDAPALKEANTGIAVEGATDAARAAANIVFTKAGLSVIIDAIKQSRVIFARMNSYAIYRIAETMRVLLLITAVILIFNIFPISVLMLVLLALLNDFPIMMIAYDNAGVHDKPTKWGMKNVLGMSSLLGGTGVIATFIMFLLGVYVFKLDYLALQTLVFLKLMVAGHMTIYLSRSGRRHFWNRPFPSKRLFLTCEITQVAATIFVVSGVLMTPISWMIALIVWGYAILEITLVDLVKVWYAKRIGIQESYVSTASPPPPAAKPAG